MSFALLFWILMLLWLLFGLISTWPSSTQAPGFCRPMVNTLLLFVLLALLGWKAFGPALHP